MIILYDTPKTRLLFYPLAATRSIASLRMGMGSIGDAWSALTGQPIFALSHPLITSALPEAPKYICIDATILPNKNIATAILQLQPGEMIEDEAGLVAWCQQTIPVFAQIPVWLTSSIKIGTQQRLQNCHDLIAKNMAFLTQSYEQIIGKRCSSSPSVTNTILGQALFLEDGVIMEGCTINTIEGPVYICKNALIMEGSCIRGPVYIGEGAVVKMGSKLYGGTNIGPACTIGGEVKNTIFQGFSNKAHDGYMGDSYVGAWCNLGAGTSNSNIKNTAGSIEAWNEYAKTEEKMGQKCGCLIGDFSRTAINTSIPGGATIGVCCSIHYGFPPYKLIPSFSWGPGEKYHLPEALQHIQQWMQLKGETITEAEKLLLTDVWNHLTD